MVHHAAGGASDSVMNTNNYIFTENSLIAIINSNRHFIKNSPFGLVRVTRIG